MLRLAAINFTAFKMLFDIYPPKERLEAVKDIGILHQAAKFDVQVFKLIFDTYPQGERVKLLTLADQRGHTTLDYALNNVSADAVKLLLELYSEQERIAIIKQTDKTQQTILHVAAKYSSDALEYLLSLLPKQDRLAQINRINKYGYSVLAKASNLSSIQVIFNVLSEAERYQAVMLANDKSSLLHEKIHCPELFEILAVV